MENSVAKTGNSGPKVRSDCEIVLEPRQEGGIVIDLISRVQTLYGESIRNQIKEILNFYKIKNAFVKVNDSGALPFVISARMEAAIKQITDSDLEFLPGFPDSNRYPTMRDRFRFSRLYLPGNSPGLMINAGLHSADGIILDLEDSVAPEKKNEARFLVRNALRQINFYGAERMVRINQGERGLEDLAFIVPHNVNLILVPKCESGEYIERIEKEIDRLKEEYKLTYDIFLMPIIESALGIENSFNIVRASAKIVAIAIGLEDYTADLGVQRTNEGNESFYARTRLVVTARAAGVQAIDSVFSDVSDMEALRKTVKISKSLGFEGMGCIHPRQIPVIRKGYAPDETEIEKSRIILTAFEEAKQKGLGVIAIGSKMIDQPVVDRAKKTISLAIQLNLLSPDWMKETHSDMN